MTLDDLALADGAREVSPWPPTCWTPRCGLVVSPGSRWCPKHQALPFEKRGDPPYFVCAAHCEVVIKKGQRFCPAHAPSAGSRSRRRSKA